MTQLAAYLELPQVSFQGVLDWTLELRREFKMPHTAAELGVAPERLDELARMALADPTAPGNPVPLDLRSLKGMYEAAMTGQL